MINESPRIVPIRSALSKEEFLERLAMTLDDNGTLWRFIPNENAPHALISQLQSEKKYLGLIAGNVFHMRRPLVEGAKSIGTVRSGY